MSTPGLIVEISRWVDDDFPGWVECLLLDAIGEPHRFVEKVSVVTSMPLRSNSTYPQQGTINCEVWFQWLDEAGRELARVDTERPDGVASSAGLTNFIVLQNQLINGEVTRLWQ